MTIRRESILLLNDEMLFKLLRRIEERFEENAKEYYEIMSDETLVHAVLIERGYKNNGVDWVKKGGKNE